MRVLTGLIFLQLFCSTAFASGVETYGDWGVLVAGNGDGVAYTAPGTNFDLALGYRCYAASKKCIHFVQPKINCDVGRKYPLLINTDSGAEVSTGVCVQAANGKYELFLSQYDLIHKILQDNKVIGIAIPLESGAFKAVRFSLNGSKKAMNRAAEIVLHHESKKPSAKTKVESYF